MKLYLKRDEAEFLQTLLTLVKQEPNVPAPIVTTITRRLYYMLEKPHFPADPSLCFCGHTEELHPVAFLVCSTFRSRVRAGKEEAAVFNGVPVPGPLPDLTVPSEIP